MIYCYKQGQFHILLALSRELLPPAPYLPPQLHMYMLGVQAPGSDWRALEITADM